MKTLFKTEKNRLKRSKQKFQYLLINKLSYPYLSKYIHLSFSNNITNEIVFDDQNLIVKLYVTNPNFVKFFDQ